MVNDLELTQLNNAPAVEVTAALHGCCGSDKWVNRMLQHRPFSDLDEILLLAEEVWWELDREDWLEAFAHHPKIGDLESLRNKFASTSHWTEGEQQSVLQSDDMTIRELADLNQQYLQKFGFIFIICATGKSAEEMLAALKARLHNPPTRELSIAAEEQKKITQLRLQKLLT